MPHEVRMPQLGMTQDSGVIVSWLKQVGDAVSDGDVLFEVETDKATMEVEARASGYLAGVRAGAGEDVPVGDIIAMIVESQTEVADHSSLATHGDMSAGSSASTVPSEKESHEPGGASTPMPRTAGAMAPEPSAATNPATVPAGKVLASPKARRLALESGVDLAALRAQGVAEPIHAADLKRAAIRGQFMLSARVRGSAFDALLQSSAEADRTMLFAAFAAGAWRKRIGAEEVGVAVCSLDGSVVVHANPDRGGGAGDDAALELIDLCDTRLNSCAPASPGITLATARDSETYELTLCFSENSLPIGDAISLLDDIAARVEDPVRQLL